MSPRISHMNDDLIGICDDGRKRWTSGRVNRKCLQSKAMSVLCVMRDDER